ncbi:helix-turn-helix domain-containing protein [Clostridioides sp. GD02377]|uniref:helix-turn-helix domain-containing protein n=1 Tax=unclassified Clostridioides TaxID=2635829 RepID=UPI0038AD87FE
MYISAAKKIKNILIQKDIRQCELAKSLGITPQMLTNRFRKNNFSEKELLEIAKKLNCEFTCVFTLKDNH